MIKITSSEITQFISYRFQIGNFSHLHPSKSRNACDFIQGNCTIGDLQVINDPAEREIELIQDFNENVMTEEAHKQFLLQVCPNLVIPFNKLVILTKTCDLFCFPDTIQEYRQKYPQATTEKYYKNHLKLKKPSNLRQCDDFVCWLLEVCWSLIFSIIVK